MTGRPRDETERQLSLLAAQDRAVELFEAVERRAVIAAGVTELEASDAIRDLAAEMFGAKKHWHKRIVRSGPNTLLTFAKNPKPRTITSDDIVFVDFGPVFTGWEADFGRTFVLGGDGAKLRLRDALAVVWNAGREHFESHPEITGEQLFAFMTAEAERTGYEFGGDIAGHLVGRFPHSRAAGPKVASYIAPGSDQPMRRTDKAEQPCHWILEVHLVDRERQIGGFYEELLDVRRPVAA
jgi:Xaa-Pro aminopeptidase